MWSFLMPMERFITIHYLSQNTVYVFRMLASNDVGDISTDNKKICEYILKSILQTYQLAKSTMKRKLSFLIDYTDTTDVQLVSVVELRDLCAFRVKCDFISGSDAQGCMVVLTGDYDNISITLLMSQTNSEIVNIANSVSCYKGVVAFDIEHDGQIGTLAVPGKLSGSFDSNTTATCLPSAGRGILY